MADTAQLRKALDMAVADGNDEAAKELAEMIVKTERAGAGGAPGGEVSVPGGVGPGERAQAAGLQLAGLPPQQRVPLGQRDDLVKSGLSGLARGAVRGFGIPADAGASVPGGVGPGERAQAAGLQLAGLPPQQRVPFQAMPTEQAIDAADLRYGEGSSVGKGAEFIGAGFSGLLGTPARAASAMKGAGGLLGGTKAAAKQVASDVGRNVASSVASYGGMQVGQEAGGAPGALIGALAGPVLPGVAARRAIAGGSGARKSLEAALDDFNKAGVSPSVGQSTQGRSAQIVEAAVSAAPGGTGPFLAAGKAQQAALGQKVDEIINARPATSTEAGIALKAGATQTYPNNVTRTAERLYNRADKYVPEGASVSPSNTAQTLAKLETDIKGMPALSDTLSVGRVRDIKKAFLKDMNQLGGKGMPYDALRQFRTRIGRLLSGSEIISQAPRGELKAIYAAISKDMKSAASAHGEKAVKAYESADAYWKRSMARMDDFLNVIAKKAEPEMIYRWALSSSKEGATKLTELRKSLHPDQWQVVRDATLRRLGTAKGGAQDAAADVFSSETFLTNYAALKKSGAADVLFGPPSSQYRRDVDRIARVASKIRSSSKVLANPSGTAGTGLAAATLFYAIGGLVGGNVGGLASVAAGAAGTNMLARLMLSPKFVNWLAKSSAIPADRIPGHVARLSVIAGEDPELAEALKWYTDQVVTELETGE